MMDANLDYSSVSSFNQIFDSFNLFAGNKIVIFNEFVCPIYKKLSIMPRHRSCCCLWRSTAHRVDTNSGMDVTDLSFNAVHGTNSRR